MKELINKLCVVEYRRFLKNQKFPTPASMVGIIKSITERDIVIQSKEKRTSFLIPKNNIYSIRFIQEVKW